MRESMTRALLIADVVLRVGLLVFAVIWAVEMLQLVHTLVAHQYLDCVASPTGGEVICKFVGITDPAYRP